MPLWSSTSYVGLPSVFSKGPSPLLMNLLFFVKKTFSPSFTVARNEAISTSNCAQPLFFSLPSLSFFSILFRRARLMFQVFYPRLHSTLVSSDVAPAVALFHFFSLREQYLEIAWNHSPSFRMGPIPDVVWPHPSFVRENALWSFFFPRLAKSGSRISSHAARGTFSFWR